MKYPIKLFNNSGILSLSSKYLLDYEPLTSSQSRVSFEIKLMVEYETIKNYEYCKIGEYCYTINDVTIISKDTCKIEIESDNYLSHMINFEYLWNWGGDKDTDK